MLLGRLQCWPPHRLLRWEPLGRDRHGRVYWLLDGAVRPAVRCGGSRTAECERGRRGEGWAGDGSRL